MKNFSVCGAEAVSSRPYMSGAEADSTWPERGSAPRPRTSGAAHKSGDSAALETPKMITIFKKQLFKGLFINVFPKYTVVPYWNYNYLFKFVETVALSPMQFGYRSPSVPQSAPTWPALSSRCGSWLPTS